LAPPDVRCVCGPPPTSLSNFKPGDITSIPYVQYGGLAWLESQPNEGQMASADNFAMASTVVGNVNGVGAQRLPIHGDAAAGGVLVGDGAAHLPLLGEVPRATGAKAAASHAAAHGEAAAAPAHAG
jgi:hypothetical protein